MARATTGYRSLDPLTVQRKFGRAAEHYDSAAWLQQSVRKACYAKARELWSPGSLVVDVGSGTGALYDESRSDCWRIIGLDFSVEMCRIAQKRGCRVVHASADCVPFTDASVDGVFSSLMLQWINDPQVVFQEFARVLREDAYAIVSTLTCGTLHELIDSFSVIDRAPHVTQFAEPVAVHGWAADAGLEVAWSDEVTKIEHHSNARSLMESLRTIGATNAHSGRRKGLMTPRQLERLERTYATQHGVAQGLPVTWQILYMLLRRA
ncbi:MAG: methyltransferase domain-containing protein [Pirellulales bacterium]|nr:methyltransferase domain-containing protein [Pirellulales bacterium]